MVFLFAFPSFIQTIFICADTMYFTIKFHNSLYLILPILLHIISISIK